MGSGKSISNVFNIITGVAIMFLIKKEKSTVGSKINYIAVDDSISKQGKLDWLTSNVFDTINFGSISPDKNNNWLNIADTDFESLVPILDKANKQSDFLVRDKLLFRYYSNGCVTNRDEWVYDFNKRILEQKLKYFFEEYNYYVSLWQKEFELNKYYGKKGDELLELSNAFVFSNKPTIKWSGRLFRDKLLKVRVGKFNDDNIRYCMYRPFTKQYLYYDYIPIDIQGQLKSFFPGRESQNVIININGNGKDFHCISTNIVADLHLTGDTTCIPLHYFNEKDERLDNITDWGLEQFTSHYKNNKITKEDIFHYTYAVLQNPAYRKKYELNLKREFPRIPFYDDFYQWVKWGKQLMELHINYETVKPFVLELHQHEVKAEAKRQKEIFTTAEESKPLFGHQPKIKAKLKADKNAGVIELDELSFLTGVPKEAWEYKLGNRSALEWVLDQYKEKKPSDPTIAEKFNTYRFADYKDKVIDLLKRVCTVSVETVAIVREMEKVRTHE